MTTRVDRPPRPPVRIEHDVEVVPAVAADACHLCGRQVVPVLVRRRLAGELLETVLGWADVAGDLPYLGEPGYVIGDAHTPERCRALRYPPPAATTSTGGPS